MLAFICGLAIGAAAIMIFDRGRAYLKVSALEASLEARVVKIVGDAKARGIL
jgi:hypothetical protein